MDNFNKKHPFGCFLITEFVCYICVFLVLLWVIQVQASHF